MTSFADHLEAGARADMGADWRDRAECKGRGRVMDPADYTVRAARTYGWERELWRPARELCWRCPVYDQCQAWVLSLPASEDVGGVCGGLTEEQRRRWRRSLPRQRRGTS